MLPFSGRLAATAVAPMNVLLISTYELGRQPFGLASPAAFLADAGHRVTCLDLSVQRLARPLVENADLIAFYLPMHTAARIASAALERVRAWNPRAHLSAYGLYAPMCADVLGTRGVDSFIGGEFESALVRLANELAGDGGPTGETSTTTHTASTTTVSRQRQQFVVPRRSGLPPLDAYAHLIAADGRRRTVGYTEASRGCKHLCRHCPVVPVYEGRFRIVQPEVVLDDIDQQVAAGAQHITFGDPDFFNGPRHALAVIDGLHRRHPTLSYDVTIKVEHLLRHAELLPRLRDTGCAFVTSAVEAVDDAILRKLDKGHTRLDFERVAALFGEVGLALQPTFVAFNPWISLSGYAELLATLARLELIDNVPSIQLAIRLLIPAGSRLLELADVRELVGPFDPHLLGYPWRHPDARVDRLQADVEKIVAEAGDEPDRRDLFGRVWRRVATVVDVGASPPRGVTPGRPRVTIPYLTEPWYC